MKYIKTILEIFFITLSFLRASTQPNTLIFQPVNNEVLQKYSIRHISAGKDGKLWLSTDHGLLSFDGNDVKIFKHNDDDANSLRSDDVWRTYTDSIGNIFVLTSFHEGNVDYLDITTGRCVHVDIIHKVEDFRIMAEPVAYADLLVDGESIWLAGYFIGLTQFNMHTKKTESYYFSGEFSAKNTVYTIRKDGNDRNLLWLGTEDGIYSFNKITKELKRNFRCANPSDSTSDDLQVTNIDVTRHDTIWFTAKGRGMGSYNMRTGLYTLYAPTNGKREKKAEAIDIIQMHKKSNDEYYIVLEHSLPAIFNTSNRTYNFSTFSARDLPSITLNNFLEDNNGNIWCVLYNHLYKAQPAYNKVSTIIIKDKSGTYENANFFKNVVWDDKEKCYYAAFEKSKAIFVIDSNFNIVRSIPLHEHNKKTDRITVYDIGLDSQGRLWVCGSSLFVYDHALKQFVESNKMFPRLLFQHQQFQNLVFRREYMYLQPSDQSYRAIYRVNLKQMDYDSIPLPEEMVKDNAGIYQPGNRLDFLVIDKDAKNTYWGYNRHSFYGYIDGIIQFNLETRKAKRISHAPVIEPQNSNHIFPYALDDSDRLWIGGLNNFSVYEPQTCNLEKYVAAEPSSSGGPMYNAEGKHIMCRSYPDGVLLYDYNDNRKYKLTQNDGIISYLNSGIALANNYLFLVRLIIFSISQ